MAKKLYTEANVRELASGAELVLGRDAVATPSALELAFARGIRVRYADGSSTGASGAAAVDSFRRTFAEDGTSEGRIMGVVNRRVPGQGSVTLFAGYEVHVVDGDVDVVVGEPAGPREDAALLCSAFTS